MAVDSSSNLVFLNTGPYTGCLAVCKCSRLCMNFHVVKI